MKTTEIAQKNILNDLNKRLKKVGMLEDYFGRYRLRVYNHGTRLEDTVRLLCKFKKYKNLDVFFIDKFQDEFMIDVIDWECTRPGYKRFDGLGSLPVIRLK